MQMRSLLLLNLIVSCLSCSALLIAAAVLCALVPWTPALVWPAAALLWAALWIRR
jgi:hypothetical protein